MPKFCANLSFMFADVVFPERFARAARAGFAGVEYLFPYAHPAAEIAGWLADAGLEQVLFNLPAGDWDGGERGIACLPGHEEEFRAGLELAREYALTLGCRRLHCVAGLTPAGVPAAEVEACYVANLRHAADRLAGDGIQVLIEPINSRLDMPGFWLDTPAQAFRLVEAIDRPNVAVQYDIYHAQIMAGDLARTIEANIEAIGHIQIADNPGRHEPGSGEIHYSYLFGLLDRLDYAGWIGCEYKPAQPGPGGTEAGLGWYAPWRR